MPPAGTVCCDGFCGPVRETAARARLPGLRLPVPVDGRRRGALVPEPRRTPGRRGPRGHLPDATPVGRRRSARDRGGSRPRGLWRRRALRRGRQPPCRPAAALRLGRAAPSAAPRARLRRRAPLLVPLLLGARRRRWRARAGATGSSSTGSRSGAGTTGSSTSAASAGASATRSSASACACPSARSASRACTRRGCSRRACAASTSCSAGCTTPASWAPALSAARDARSPADAADRVRRPPHRREARARGGRGDRAGARRRARRDAA